MFFTSILQMHGDHTKIDKWQKKMLYSAMKEVINLYMLNRLLKISKITKKIGADHWQWQYNENIHDIYYSYYNNRS